MNKKILLVLPVPFQEVEGCLGLDEQTCDELVRWADNFDNVVLACPILPQHMAANSDVSMNWRSLATLPCAERLELLPLPYAYKLQDFMRSYSSTSQLLATKIQECQYLCFVIGGLIGDWAAIAGLQAIKLGRPYSIWTDRVEYEVIRRTLKQQPLKRRIKEFFTLPLLKPYQRYLISRCSLGLFQGQDCFAAYSPFCSEPHCVYYVCTKKSDRINRHTLESKIESVLAGKPLQICYAGRAAEMKGAIDWVNTMQRLSAAGVDFQATWLGEGPLLPQMKSLAQELGISDRIHFLGYVNDRSQILETIKNHHIFLFCHKTPESARCLIESLVCGCPIVGYESHYPKGLVAEHGGGIFAPMNDWQKLADIIIELNLDRAKLSQAIVSSAKSGEPFDQETVFRHRSNLIKKYLSAPA